MQELYQKILVIILIILGEGFAIYAEMFASKQHFAASSPFWQIFLKMFLIITIGGGLLLLGYMLGYSFFKNIWVVSAISITSILIIEPLLAWTFFKQIPTRGAIIGLCLGALGFISALFF